MYLRKYAGQRDHGKIVGSYIGGLKKKIVVDTGAPEMERALKYHAYAMTKPNKPDQNSVSQLEKIGVKPEEIDIVILTHLHWDHVGEVTKFPNAEFIASHVELRFALDPIPALYVAYEAPQIGMEPIFLQVMERLKTVEMKEQEIVDGVRVIPLPGHTPGHLGVVVDTEDGPYVIVGDAAPQWGNLEGSPEEKLPYLMSGIYTDMEAMWKSFERIDDIVKGDYRKVIPGHEKGVFQKDRYPS
jgi:N-acyl homoserine lactone hydrolase